MSVCRAVPLIFAAVALFARGQEDAVELSAEHMRGIHELIDNDKDGKASLLELLSYSEKMRHRIAAKDAKATLEELDTDHDGKLSEAEIMAELGEEQPGEGEEHNEEIAMYMDREKEKFKVADANSDGFLSGEEVSALFYPETHSAVLEVSVKHEIALLDKDGDNQLNPEEFEAQAGDEHDFYSLDTDGNKFLSAEELKLWEGGLYHSNQAMKHILEIADSDKDNHLTADELEKAREQIIDSDANHHFSQWVKHSEL